MPEQFGNGEMIDPTAGVGEGIDLGPETAPEIPQHFQRLIKYCFDLYEDFKGSSYRKEKIDEARASRQAYALKTDAEPLWPNASNEVMPFVLLTVDNLEPRIHSALVGRDPIVEFEMEGRAEKDDITRIIQAWFNQELKNTIGIDTKAMAMVHDVLLDGTVFVTTSYDRKKQKRKEFIFNRQGQVAVNGLTREPYLREVEVVKSEGCSLESISMNDLFFPDDIGTIEGWEKCPKIRKLRPTYAELMDERHKPGYMNIGPWLFDHKQRLNLSGDNDGSQSPGQETAGVEVTGKEVIDCLEFHISYPISRDDVDKDEKEQDNFKEEKIVFTVAENTKVPIRLIRQIDLTMNNETQIKRMRLFPESGQSYGSPLYAKLKSVHKIGSDLYNQLINCAMIAMMPWFLYDDRSGIKQRVQIQPGQGVPVDNVEGVRFATFQANPQSFLVFLQTVISMWERLGNIGDLQIGRPSETAGKNKTATEVMAVIQEGNIRYNYQARTMKEEFIVILRAIYDLYYQNMPFDKTFYYAGQQVAIPRAEMRRPFKFQLVGSSETANKLIERKEAEDLYTLGMQNPLVNPVKVVEDLLKAYGRNNTQEYIRPEITQVMQAMAGNPEIPQVIGRYLQTKAAINTEIQTAPVRRPSPQAVMQEVGNG